MGRLKWVKHQVALLGSASDERVAKMLGVAKSTVSNQRWKRKIPAFGLSTKEKTVVWSEEQLGLLGKVRDAEIARLMGVSSATIVWKRCMLGIPPVGKQGTRRVWKESEIQLLGTLPDTVVARKLLVHRHQVAIKRHELGIAPYKQYFNWDEKSISLLGVLSDSEIARKLGISVTSVRGFRIRRGIPKGKISSPNRLSRANPNSNHLSWTESRIQRLGKERDASLAREFGCSRNAIFLKRKKLGIPVFKKNKAGKNKVKD